MGNHLKDLKGCHERSMVCLEWPLHKIQLAYTSEHRPNTRIYTVFIVGDLIVRTFTLNTFDILAKIIMEHNVYKKTYC